MSDATEPDSLRRRVANRFRRNWFAGVFVILLGVWLVTGLAYAFGAKSISFGNRYGPKPTIDFMRQHDHPVLVLGEGVGLELTSGSPNLSGAVVALAPGAPVLRAVCGYFRRGDGIGLVGYRAGDWFFRAPFDNSRNDEARNGREVSRSFILTIAYNRATGERVMVDVGASLDDQAQTLASHGLTAVDSARLTLDSLADLQSAAVLREGCAIVNLAFVAAAILWFVVGGLAVVLARAFRRRPHPPDAE